MKKNNILRLLKDYRKECVLSPLFKFLESAMELLVPLVVAKIIDVGIPQNNKWYLFGSAGILLAFGVFGLLFAVFAQYFAAKTAVGFSKKTRRALFVHMQGFSYSTLDKLGAPTLITRVTSDVNQVQTGINITLRLALRSPFIVFGALVFALLIDAKISLIFVGAIALLGVIVGIIMSVNIPMFKKIQGKIDGVLGGVRNNLTGARVVRAFNREDAEKQEFNEKNNSLTREQLKAGRISALLNPLTLVVVNLAIVLIMKFGAVKVNIGELSSGQVVALFNYMSQILVELIKLVSLIISITKAIASGKRIQAILDIPNNQDLDEGISKKVENNECANVVQFENVSITYQGAQAPSLQNLTFAAKKGERIGIIGGTGSGKTTLANLLGGFYFATEGAVKINGKDITTYDAKELRRYIHVVPQKAVLFSGTIKENLLWGGEATDEELWNALEIAQCRDVVENKSGLDAPVKQGGANFSGGQRQRLTVARGLVGNPKILILDDSSSALDYATDYALREAISHMESKPTTFIISQRASSVMNADKIIVLDDGLVDGYGTHDELMETSKVYKEIYESQFGVGGGEDA